MKKQFFGKTIALCSLAVLLVASAPLSASADMGSQVQNALSMYKNVNVEMDGKGTAILTGTVNNKSEKDDAVKRVREMPGVKSVDDKLIVTDGKSGSTGMYVDDTVITAEVKAKLLAQKGLDSLDISVETVKGTVTLTGEVDSHAQISLAESIAGKVDGVKNVANRLTVKK